MSPMASTPVVDWSAARGTRTQIGPDAHPPRDPRTGERVYLPRSVHGYAPLEIHLEHGPENHSRRTQCMPRIVDWVQPYPVIVRLAACPPSHPRGQVDGTLWGRPRQSWARRGTRGDRTAVSRST